MTPTETATDTPAVIDWTGRACESPGYQSALGTYAGELQFLDDAPRSCRWNAEIVIAGRSEADSEVCTLSGSINVTLVEQGTQLENTPYICAEMSQPTGYATGLTQGLDLNVSGQYSFILQMEVPHSSVDANGIALVNALTQFEAVLVGEGGLIATTGTLQKRN